MGTLSRLFLLLVVGVFAISLPALAADSGDRTQFGHDIVVASNEKVTDVTCFGCNVHIRGQVTSDVTTFGGTIVVEEDGQIAGDTTSFGGDVRLDSGAKLSNLTVFGGKIHRDPGASISGDVTTFAGGAALWLFVVFGLPFLLLGALIALIIWLVRRYSRPAMPVAARV